MEQGVVNQKTNEVHSILRRNIYQHTWLGEEAIFTIVKKLKPMAITVELSLESLIEFMFEVL
jgi:hypothetical protein